MITVRNILPIEVQSGEFDDCDVQKYLDHEVVMVYKLYDLDSSNVTTNSPQDFGFKHKNIVLWATFFDGDKLKAVGFNENPSVGWSFPVINVKLKKLTHKEFLENDMESLAFQAKLNQKYGTNNT